MDKGFPALRRRRRFLEQEVYFYEKYMRDAKDITPSEQNQQALNAENNIEELDELDSILRFWERQNNGYRLNSGQWMILFLVLAVAVSLLLLYVIQAVR